MFASHARGAMQLRRSLLSAAGLVTINAALLLVCYMVPPQQSHRHSRVLAHLQSNLHPTQCPGRAALNVSMLTVTMTGCSTAADWQAMGLYHSFLRYTQP